MAFNSFRSFRLELKLERFRFSEGSTIGRLLFGDFVLAYTLEPSLCSKDLINEDIYSVSFAETPEWSRFYGDVRYQYQVRLEDKNGRKGILFHIGNTSEDTEGCILVGDSYDNDFVYNSSSCYQDLVSFLRGFASFLGLGKSDVFKFTLVVTHK